MSLWPGRRKGPREPRRAPAAGDGSDAPSRRRRLCFRLFAAGLALFLAWGVPEAIVRISNPPLESYRAIVFGDDPNSLKLFMKDWQLHWKLRPSVDIEFLNTRVQTNSCGFRGDDPAPGRQVVLCLGDSTVFGWRVGQAESFPARLQALLDAPADRANAWTVVNAGVPGYTSFQVRQLAEKLVPRWKPRIIVVCAGNNDAWPVERSDRQRDAGSALTGRLGGLLSHSRFLVWAGEKLRRETPQPFIAPAAETAVPRVALEEYRENLREISRIARAAGAKLILLVPPADLYWPPVRFNQFPGWERWRDFYLSIEELASHGQQAKARDEVNAALAREPDSFYALWIKGKTMSSQGDIDGGRELLEQALERHPFPEACRRSYRRVVTEVAGEGGLSCIDVNDLFRRHAPGSTPRGLYLDWCHPTPQGQALIAAALCDAIGGER